jgi:hypothetical protein
MKKLVIAVGLLLSLSIAGTADARKRFSSGGGTPTNYGYAIINGVFVSFVCTTSCTVTSPTWLSGRTVVNVNGTWQLL